jgi:hypothetical protein
VDLNPLGAFASFIFSSHGQKQVGATYTSSGYASATLWQGSGNATSLNPSGALQSVAYGICDTCEAGVMFKVVSGVTKARAVAWQDTSAKYLDLGQFIPSPHSSDSSVACGASCFKDLSGTVLVTDIVGERCSDNFNPEPIKSAGEVFQPKAAALWSIQPTGQVSYVDLSPKNSDSSCAYSTDGLRQVGYATYISNKAPVRHAGVWSGSAESFTDLNPSSMIESWATSVSGPFVAGACVTPASYSLSRGSPHACFWDTSRNLFMDLGKNLPSIYVQSIAFGVTQAPDGTATIVGSVDSLDGANGFVYHAAEWQVRPWGAAVRIILKVSGSKWSTGGSPSLPYRDDYLVGANGTELFVASQIQSANGTIGIPKESRILLKDDVSSIQQMSTPVAHTGASVDMYVSSNSTTALALATTDAPYYSQNLWNFKRCVFDQTLKHYYLQPFSLEATPFYAIPRVQGAFTISQFDSLIRSLAKQFSIPAQVLGGVFWQETTWHQFQFPGDTIPGTVGFCRDLPTLPATGQVLLLIRSLKDQGSLLTPDGGIGVGQITGSTVFSTVPPSTGDPDEALLNHIYRLASDPSYGLSFATARLNKTLDKSLHLGTIKSSEFIEHWLLNVSAYNGATKDAGYRAKVAYQMSAAPWLKRGGTIAKFPATGTSASDLTDGQNGYFAFDNLLSASVKLTIIGSQVNLSLGALLPSEVTLRYSSPTGSSPYIDLPLTSSLGRSAWRGTPVTPLPNVCYVRLLLKIGSKTYIASWLDSPTIKSFAVPATIHSGQKVLCSVQLATPVPPEVCKISVSSSDIKSLSVPTLPVNFSPPFVNFYVTAPVGITTQRTVNVTVTLNGNATTHSIQVMP